jgi:hypothetical protein
MISVRKSSRLLEARADLSGESVDDIQFSPLGIAVRELTLFLGLFEQAHERRTEDKADYDSYPE